MEFDIIPSAPAAAIQRKPRQSLLLRVVVEQLSAVGLGLLTTAI
jgi:hypothetical protein